MRNTRAVILAWMLFLLSWPSGAFLNAQNSHLPRLHERLIRAKPNVWTIALRQADESPRRRRENIDALIKSAQWWIDQAEEDSQTDLSVAGEAIVHVVAKVNAQSITDELSRWAQSPNRSVQMTAIEAIGQNEHLGALPMLIELTLDEDFEGSFGYRFNLMRAMVRLRDPTALHAVLRLPVPVIGQIRADMIEYLNEIGADDFPDEETFFAWQRDYRQWLDGEPLTATPQHFASTTGPTTRPSIPLAGGPQKVQPNMAVTSTDRLKQSIKDLMKPKPSIELASARQPNESERKISLDTGVQFYGMNIDAFNVAFIIDVSGSMSEYSVGDTRLARAQAELINVLQRLPSTHRFALIFFNHQVNVWKDELRPATEANKSAAIEFVRRLTPYGRTNTRDALVRSLELDPSLEAVYFLTDGRPTFGSTISPKVITRQIEQLNRYRHLHFNCVGVGLDLQTQDFLRKLSDKSGGEFRSLDAGIVLP